MELDLRVLGAGFTSSSSVSGTSTGSLRLRFDGGAGGSTDARVLDDRRGGMGVAASTREQETVLTCVQDERGYKPVQARTAGHNASRVSRT